MKRLTREQRLIIERDYLFYTDSQLASIIGSTRWQVYTYRAKIGLRKNEYNKGAGRVDWLLNNTILKDEVVDLMILGYNTADITRELKSKYLLSRWAINKIIKTRIHHSTRARWERTLLQ